MSAEAKRCRAKDCTNELSDLSEVLCASCTIEMDRLLRVELGNRLGRTATDADVDQLFANLEAQYGSGRTGSGT